MAISADFVVRIYGERADHLPPGMDLLSWQVPDADWSELLERATDEAANRFSRRPARALVASLGLGTYVTWLLVDTSVLIPIGPVVAGAGTVAAATLALARLFRNQSLAQTLRSSSFRAAPRVAVTSTGITAGNAAATWSGDTVRLREARLEIRPPVRLILQFERRRWLWGPGETWELPVPEEVVHDADELVAHLQDRIKGRNAAHQMPPRSRNTGG